jgi:hypothetical protein
MEDSFQIKPSSHRDDHLLIIHIVWYIREVIIQFQLSNNKKTKQLLLFKYFQFNHLLQGYHILYNLNYSTDPHLYIISISILFKKYYTS